MEPDSAGLDRPFNCDNCPKKYLRKNNLEDHVLMEHPDTDQVGPELSSICTGKGRLESGRHYTLLIPKRFQAELSALVRLAGKLPALCQCKCVAGQFT